MGVTPPSSVECVQLDQEVSTSRTLLSPRTSSESDTMTRIAGLALGTEPNFRMSLIRPSAWSRSGGTGRSEKELRSPEFAQRNGLTTHVLEYSNGFPANVHQSLNVFQKLIYYPAKLLTKRVDPWIKRHPSKLYSGEIVALFSR